MGPDKNGVVLKAKVTEQPEPKGQYLIEIPLKHMGQR